jgi:oligopeptidase A
MAVMSSTTTQNPLLIGAGLPPFDALQPEQVVPGVEKLIEALERDLETLEATVQPTWAGLVEPLTRMEERLRWTDVGHYRSPHGGEE